MEAFKVLRYMMFKDLLTYYAVKYRGISILVLFIEVDEDIVKQSAGFMPIRTFVGSDHKFIIL